MKANAPEKIYIDANENWLRTYTVYTEKAKGNDIEYTRTDALIEKAIEYIITHIPDMHTLGVSAKMDDCIIKDFRKYMEE